MADSSSHKAQKVGEKHKYSNMINRTTSESIRLSDSDKILNHPTTLSATSTNPKKKTSFQITSVTVGSHTSNDGGDDSADDLDESHAEDISDVIDTSRATDIENETPSYSEDTFSKDDVFYNSSTSLGTAPVIPTSSQYGLAIVSTPEGCSNIINANVPGGSSGAGNDIHVNVSDNVINLGIVSGKHLEGDMRDLHSHTGRNERFKVVKIESTEPFKRGRWMCMDYLDHTMVQQQHQLQTQGSVTSNIGRIAESNEVSNINQCTGTDSGISMSDHPNTLSTLDEHSHVDHSSSLTANSLLQDQQNLITHSLASVTGQNSVSPGQTMQFSTQGGNVIQPVINASQPQVMQQGQSLTAVLSQHPLLASNQHQSLQPQQIQQVLSSTNIHGQQSPQQIQPPIQQMQHQGVPLQHVQHSIHQPQTAPNMVPQQQYQPAPQMQPIHHQQTPLQQVPQNTQPILQQQPTMTQHMQQQPVQHQHNIPMSVQQQINQGQMPTQVPQTVIQNQSNMQQIQQQQSAQMPVHSQIQQMQQGPAQHIQHVPVQQIPIGGVGTTQGIPAQTSQHQSYHLPTSQSMIQPGLQSQPTLMPVQQPQYFPNSQIQGTNMNIPNQGLQNTVLQSQAQPNPIGLQQNYSVNSMNQQQPQQIPVGHSAPPTSMPHLSQQQIPATGVPVMMSQPASLPCVNNLSIPASQNTVISPQATSQGPTLLQQQYISQPVGSSIAPTQVSAGPQTYASSAVNAVPSVVENVQVYPVEISAEQTSSNQQVESLDAPNVEDSQIEDAESASGASAVAIDNKIEQAMDLVKSHLMFAVREEVEVLKEKIAELMDRINQLEMENAVLKANATQETLAQLPSSLQPPTSNGP
uniref:Uncharacterized protein n=1 Tax=Graphocephala atropunctata TaxID=36148 RepID=A0A1B6MRJ8_9HEMI